ncbi:unnamed protein product, partial [Amoebophrya sp. A120]|eukprot:GSA120T00014690001.1
MTVSSGFSEKTIEVFAAFMQYLQEHKLYRKRLCFAQLNLWYLTKKVFPDPLQIRRYAGQVTSGPMELGFASKYFPVWSGTTENWATWQYRWQHKLTKTYQKAVVYPSDTNPAENVRRRLLNEEKTMVIT